MQKKKFYKNSAGIFGFFYVTISCTFYTTNKNHKEWRTQKETEKEKVEAICRRKIISWFFKFLDVLKQIFSLVLGQEKDSEKNG